MSEWQEISTAPAKGEFLAYGLYHYHGDKHVTEYIEIAWRTGDKEWPIQTHEGQAKAGVFTHWMPLPSPPSPSPHTEGQHK